MSRCPLPDGSSLPVDPWRSTSTTLPMPPQLSQHVILVHSPATPSRGLMPW